MTNDRCWAALVTFERLEEGENEVLPGWAYGACGWMIALASSQDEARSRLVRDVQHHALRVVEIENEREVLGDDEIADLDEHLASNFRNIEPPKQTVWGTLHGYKGEAEA